MKPETRRCGHIFIVSYRIFHQKSHQNTEKSTNFDIFHIQKRIQEGCIGEQQPGLVNSYQYVVSGKFNYFHNAKTVIFDDFFRFLSVFVSFFKKLDDFRVTTLKYAPRPRPLFCDLVQPGWLVSIPTCS